ncbi:MAG: NAD(P)/FAD-dependent oxidoreductase [Myxococcales bacterium]|nr:NAD(P)/FAD-dependent oxidoreductase [Myxococcales bacterium]
MSTSYDAVVVGCGPAGSVAAAELAKAGLSVLALERYRFPRFRVGESLTVSAGDLVREWGLEAEMARLDFPPKSGVKVIGRSARTEFFVEVARPTWQVRRAEFDELLLNRAIEAGVEHRWGSVKRVTQQGDRVVGVGFRPEGRKSLVDVRAEVVIDATGHSALMSRQGVAGPRQMGTFDRQIATFTQFTHAVRDPGAMGNNTFIFYGSKYHWAWFIPVSSTVTSVGVVLPTTTHRSVASKPEEVLAWGLEHVNPDLWRRVQGLTPSEPVRVIRNYSYRIDPFVGDGWLCVGDAHRFPDPIFSFGVSFAMTEARAAAEAVVRARWTGDAQEPFERYAAYCSRGQDAAMDLIQYFWKFPAFFSFQTRGSTRGDMIQLLGGDCFGTQENGVLDMMRKSLREVDAPRPAAR